MTLSVQGFGSNSPTTVGFGGSYEPFLVPISMIYKLNLVDVFEITDKTDVYKARQRIDKTT